LYDAYNSLNSRIVTAETGINSLNANKIYHFTQFFDASTVHDYLKALIDYAISNGTGIYTGAWSGNNYHIAFIYKISPEAAIGAIAYGIGLSAFYTISRNGSQYLFKNEKGEVF
jgi:hypothetical protein